MISGENENNVTPQSDANTPYPAQPSYTPPEPAYTSAPAYSAPATPRYATPPVYNVPPATGYATPPAQSQNMYTPGIGMNQPQPRPRAGAAPPVRSQRERGSAGGRFVRALCLVLVCSLFSATAAYYVTDFRFKRGDFTPTTNQVILGGRQPAELPPYEAQEDYTQPLITTSDESLSPQDIYDLALTQVVGVRITPTSSSRFFGSQEMIPSVVGSGFFVSEDGYILTNYHVVEMAHEQKLPISVVLHDGESYEAEVVGFDASSDVAVLKIEKDGLSPAVIGDSSALRVGQSVYAVGNPFGDLVYTMTDGIVSALDRVVSVDGKTISAFQFSAAVNSGNSGGPIYNTRGEVIGIVTAKVIRGSVEGIGFAIPIQDAIDIAAAIIEFGYISGRPLLGVTVQTVYYEIPNSSDIVIGVGIRSVNAGSAAEKAGLRIGDIITAIGEEQVDSVEALRFAMRMFKANETAVITIWRDGEMQELSITFDEDLSAGRPEPTPTPSLNLPNPFE